MLHAWKSTFNDVVDRHAPLHIEQARSSKSPWILPVLKQCMHERDILRIKVIQYKDPNDWSAFKKASNSVNSEIKLAEENYYKSAFGENGRDIKKTWGIVNRLT